MTPRALNAILTWNDPPRLFAFGSELVRIDDAVAGTVTTVDKSVMKWAAGEAVYWYRPSRDGAIPAYPPDPVVANLLATPSAPFPVLERIVSTPTFTASGELVTQTGYSRATGIYYAPSEHLVGMSAVPPVPTDIQIKTAVRVIREELLGDFPFARESDIAHAIALLLTPFVRSMIEGPTPLFVVDAPSPGSGKSLLVQAAMHPAFGNIPFMSEAKDDEEWHRRLTAALSVAPGAIVVDNVARKLDSAALASAVTSAIYQDRKIRSSDVISMPVRCVWVATGNNVSFSHEIARRIVPIRLVPSTEAPWEHRKFRHENLLMWVRENRAQLVHAGLTLIMRWIHEGRPRGPQPPLGSFEEWSWTVSGILQVAGVTGFLADREVLMDEANEDREVLRAFVARWFDAFGTRVVTADDLGALVCDLWDLEAGSRHAVNTRIGRHLGKLRDQIADGKRITRIPKLRPAGYRLQVLDRPRT